jgi:hypothetical protein
VQAYYASPQVWYTLDAALALIRRGRPELLWVRGWHARVACVAGHYDVARRELAAIGGDHRGGGFASARSQSFYEDWAKNGRLPESR